MSLPRLFFVRLAFVLCALIFAQGALCEARPPNIVVLLADDAGWGDYGFNGNVQVRTPNLDALARQGTVLSAFYVCPVCSPTRAEFLTGRYYPRCGVQGGSLGQERLNLDETTLAQVFQRAGYATGIFGKWHNGTQWPYHPLARGFETFFGYTSGHWGEYFDPLLEAGDVLVREKGYIVDICTTKALEFMERHRDRPFLCYVPFTTPHSPWAVPEKNWATWKDRPLVQTGRDPALENPDQTRCVLAMIENQDENVGRILAKLEQLHLASETIVLFFSDNGPNTSRWNGGLKGQKGGVDEGGVRSAFALRYPGRVPAGHTANQIAGAIDLLPTLAHLAGVPVETRHPMDGISIASVLLGQVDQLPERRIFSHWGARTSVRTPRFRMDSEGNLFDLSADPGQTQACNAQHPREAEALQSALKAWREEMGVTRSPGAKGVAQDKRPFPVGYREFPVTLLPARDGVPRGGLARSAPAPNSSYFVNWTSPAAYAEWNVEVHTSGSYEVRVDYACAKGDEGCLLRLEFEGAALEARVERAWDPPLYTNQDTLARNRAESGMKEFASLSLGTIQLPAGVGPLRLRAPEIPGKAAVELRRLTLRLRE